MLFNTRERHLAHQLFPFGDGEWFRGSDGAEGVQIWGALGTGKTTGSGFTLAQAYLRAGYGGLVLTSKPDELRVWAETYFADTGRSAADDIVVIQPEYLHPQVMWPQALLGNPKRSHFNALQYEYESGGGFVSNVVDVLFPAVAAHEGEPQSAFWDSALREMTTHALELQIRGHEALHGKAEIRLADILEIILTGPTSIAEIDSSRFKAGLCWQLIAAADRCRHHLREDHFRDLQLAATYWLSQFPALAPETRTSIQQHFSSKITALLRSPLRELLCSDTDDRVTPPRSFNATTPTGHPKIIIVNLPVKLYGEVGRFAQTMIKAAWQRGAERRIKDIDEAGPLWRPNFLWSDESQYFVTRMDAGFQQTARSSFVATTYLTQNLPNYYVGLGEQVTHSLLGNLQTKIFHANGDPTTNEWAERVFGNALSVLRTHPLTGRGPSSEAQSFHPVIRAAAFASLKKGGYSTDAQSNGRVGSYIFQAGRDWKSQRADRHYHEFVQPLSRAGR